MIRRREAKGNSLPNTHTIGGNNQQECGKRMLGMENKGRLEQKAAWQQENMQNWRRKHKIACSTAATYRCASEMRPKNTVAALLRHFAALSGKSGRNVRYLAALCGTSAPTGSTVLQSTTAALAGLLQLLLVDAVAAVLIQLLLR